MAHMALYRKWRPLTFEDVVEQRHIVTTLKNSIRNNTISHAYLFCGTRGTGKTTLAKLFARAVNCPESVDGSPCNQCETCRGILDGSIIDVVEIDAASNNGVDDVREIKEAVMYVPAVTKYKVYIIDEVHMLSTGAFNALLKTLEEPPENVVFILATTEPQKLPATILSRCQRFDFKRITREGIVSRLRLISEDCGVTAENSALQLIARLSEGGMRDAINLLDQVISLGKGSVSRQDVVEISGLTATQTVDEFSRAIVERDARRALNAIKTAMDEGRDLLPLCTQVIDWFRNLMLVQTGGEALSLIDLDEEELQPVKKTANDISPGQTVEIIRELSEMESRLKWTENQRILFEVTAVKLCARSTLEPGTLSGDGMARLEALDARIGQLEMKLSRLAETGRPMSAEAAKPVRETARNPQKTEREPKNVPHNAPSGDFSGDQTLKQWPDVVETVRSMGKMKVYAYLLDTRCRISNSAASVIVPGDDGLKKTVLSRNDSLEVIREALKKITGLELDVKITDDKALAPSPKAEEDPALEKIKKFAEENNIPLNIEE